MLRIALAIAGDARHRPLKPFACGNAGRSGGLVVTNSCAFYTFAREAAGAFGARHSPRPFGRMDLASPGRKAVAGR
jgi:hypothetical protein